MRAGAARGAWWAVCAAALAEGVFFTAQGGGAGPEAATYPFESLACADFNFIGDGCDCSTPVRGAYVRLEPPGFQAGEDVLWCERCREGDLWIRGSYDAARGVLELSGERPLGHYAAAVASVRFLTTEAAFSALPTARRMVTYNFGDALYRSETGSMYKLRVPGDDEVDCNTALGTNNGGMRRCMWGAAQADCASSQQDILGMMGYLIVADSKEERELDTLQYPASPRVPTAWAGCTDLADEGTFHWVTGPEGCPSEYKYTARGPARSACDLGFPINSLGGVCTAPGCGRGTPVSDDAWLDGQPDDSRVVPAGIPPGSGTWDAGEDFCRLENGKLSDTTLHPQNYVEMHFCEFTPAVGALCLDMADLVKRTVLYPSPYPEPRDECTPHAAGVVSAAPVVSQAAALFPSPINCEEAVVFFGAGCSCDTVLDGDVAGARVVIAAGFMPGDQLKLALGTAYIGRWHVEEVGKLTPDTHGVLELAPGPAAKDLTLRAALAAVSLVVYISSAPPGASAPRVVTWNVLRAVAPAAGRVLTLHSLDPSVGEYWAFAAEACVAKKILGMGGYLATLTSEAEEVAAQALMEKARTGASQPRNAAWIGAMARQQTWAWVTGPESKCAAVGPMCDFSVAISANRALATCSGDCSPGAAAFGVEDHQAPGRFAAADATTYVDWAPGQPDQRNGKPVGSWAGRDDVAAFAAFERSDDAGGWSGWVDFSGAANGQVVRAICEFSPDFGRLCVDLATLRGTVTVFPAAYMSPALIPGGCPPSQRCADADFVERADWECVCLPPLTGRATARPATCATPEDDCAPGSSATAVCGSFQTCVDTSAAAGDWLCVCIAPYVGTGQQRPAACLHGLDECVPDPSCATCAPAGACGTALQECVDPDLNRAAVGDWFCECVPPAAGAPQVGGRAACTLDECEAACGHCAGGTCADAGQRCLDQDVAAEATLDWLCRCYSHDGVGMQDTAPALCVFDECTAECPTCLSEFGGGCGANQTCRDLAPYPQVLGDWACNCDAPASGSRRPGVTWSDGNAVCAYNECANAAPGAPCGAFQKCTDRDPHAWGTWVCECQAPEAGPPTLGGPAACVVDECELVPCGAAGPEGGDVQFPQICEDGDVSVRGDFVCTCGFPFGDVQAVGAPGVCTNSSTPPELYPAGAELKKTGAVAAVLGIFAGQTGQNLRLLVLLASCSDGGAGINKYAVALHPTQLSLGGSVEKGVIVGNLAVAAGAWLLLGAACLAGRVAVPQPQDAPRFDVLGAMRFPSLPFLVTHSLYQAIAMSAMALMINAADLGSFFIGFGALALCAVATLTAVQHIRAGVPALAVNVRDPEKQPWLARHLLGPSEWVNRSGKVDFVHRWGSWVWMYRMDTAPFLAVEQTASLAVAAIAAVRPERPRGCGHVHVAYTSIFILLLGFHFATAPYRHARNNLFETTALLCQAVAMVFTSVGFYRHEGTGRGAWFALAGSFLWGASGVMLVRAALDVAAWVYAWFVKRRPRLQDAFLKDQRERREEHQAARARARSWRDEAPPVLVEHCWETHSPAARGGGADDVSGRVLGATIPVSAAQNVSFKNRPDDRSDAGDSSGGASPRQAAAAAGAHPAGTPLLSPGTNVSLSWRYGASAAPARARDASSASRSGSSLLLEIPRTTSVFSAGDEEKKARPPLLSPHRAHTPNIITPRNAPLSLGANAHTPRGDTGGPTTKRRQVLEWKGTAEASGFLKALRCEPPRRASERAGITSPLSARDDTGRSLQTLAAPYSQSQSFRLVPHRVDRHDTTDL
eukprot:TRINITY_DN1443_c1_g1_i1.p1 TRINITY_DN1443_c1_g1~~TRINITY_DN1443_c1_g1_i1.p1  ORF type:complete len:1776 (+),score=379.94 TRINITY_DN1443_c1_g1_i1:151-5478(+)